MSSNSNERELITREFFDSQRKLEKVSERRRVLIAQESENQMVSRELELLDNDAIIYKLIGSVMVKQSLDEAKSTVSKRLEYIASEIQSVNKTFESLKNALVEKSNQVRSYLELALVSTLSVTVYPQLQKLQKQH